MSMIPQNSRVSVHVARPSGSTIITGNTITNYIGVGPIEMGVMGGRKVIVPADRILYVEETIEAPGKSSIA